MTFSYEYTPGQFVRVRNSRHPILRVGAVDRGLGDIHYVPVEEDIDDVLHDMRRHQIATSHIPEAARAFAARHRWVNNFITECGGYWGMRYC